jgi:putative flippase GtrA
MAWIPEPLSKFVTWAMIRYAISGTIVAAFYLGAPIAINAVLGVPLEVCLPVVYVMAVSLQFTLQRLFVFRHITEFALTVRQQIRWYVVIAAVQYPLSALATAFLPKLLGVPQRAVYIVATLTIALCTFLFLRRRVFPGGAEPAPVSTVEVPVTR